MFDELKHHFFGWREKKKREKERFLQSDVISSVREAEIL